MDHRIIYENIGYTYSKLLYGVQLCCFWHSCSLSRIKNPAVAPRFNSSHDLAALYSLKELHSNQQPDAETSCRCHGCSLRNTNWSIMRCYTPPLPFLRFIPKISLKHFHLRYTHKIIILLILCSTVLLKKFKSSLTLFLMKPAAPNYPIII